MKESSEKLPGVEKIFQEILNKFLEEEQYLDIVYDYVLRINYVIQRRKYWKFI